MATIQRVRAEWSGFVGAPGVSTFYTVGAAAFLPALHAFYAALSSILAPPVVISIDDFGDELEDTTGVITGSWTSDPVAAIVSTQSGVATYSAATGAVVEWLTQLPLLGRRRLGKTFIVPLGASAYDDNGSLSDGALTVLRPAAAQLVTASESVFMVWSRPFKGKPATATKPERPAHDGRATAVTGSRVPDMAAVLRSRRN
jgi:hypothetical protein